MTSSPGSHHIAGKHRYTSVVDGIALANAFADSVDVIDAVKANADRGALGDSGGADPLMSPSNPNSVNYIPNGISAPKMLWDKPYFDKNNNG